MKQKIESNFKRDETFSLDDIPKSFESVTDKSIREVKDYCARTIGDKYHGEYNPGALKSMLETIFGEFDYVYAVLENDYNTRKGNLQEAHQEGLANLQEDIVNFKNQIDLHNDLYQQYADAAEKVTGRRPNKKLMFDDSGLDQFENDFNKMIKEA